MKTNRILLSRLAIIVGTFWMISQSAAQAETAQPAPRDAGQIKTVTAEQPRILLASTSCTRVGNRMVC